MSVPKVNVEGTNVVQRKHTSKSEALLPRKHVDPCLIRPLRLGSYRLCILASCSAMNDLPISFLLVDVHKAVRTWKQAFSGDPAFHYLFDTPVSRPICTTVQKYVLIEVLVVESHRTLRDGEKLYLTSAQSVTLSVDYCIRSGIGT